MSSPDPKGQPQASSAQVPPQVSTEAEEDSGSEYADDGYGSDL